jgi:hypothetical protein
VRYRPPFTRRVDVLESDLADLRGKVNTLCEAMVLITRGIRTPEPERPQLRLVRGVNTLNPPAR